MSSEVTVPSPPSYLTVNIKTCTKKQNDWITTANPPITVLFDVRNPPSSKILATRAYTGPRLDVCGNPVLSLYSNNAQLAFLTNTFDASTKTISITLPDAT